MFEGKNYGKEWGVFALLGTTSQPTASFLKTASIVTIHSPFLSTSKYVVRLDLGSLLRYYKKPPQEKASKIFWPDP